MKEFIAMWKNIGDFNGRATRREYWMPILVELLVEVVMVVVIVAVVMVAMLLEESSPVGSAILIILLLIPLVVYNIAYFIARLSLSVRRLHDIGQSGWMLLVYRLLYFLCYIGVIVELVFMCLDSTDDNQWGPNKKRPQKFSYGDINKGINDNFYQ
jgi:uncharacterized membrane protein YhaH (DUF805 family)